MQVPAVEAETCGPRPTWRGGPDRKFGSDRASCYDRPCKALRRSRAHSPKALRASDMLVTRLLTRQILDGRLPAEATPITSPDPASAKTAEMVIEPAPCVKVCVRPARRELSIGAA